MLLDAEAQLVQTFEADALACAGDYSRVLSALQTLTSRFKNAGLTVEEHLSPAVRKVLAVAHAQAHFAHLLKALAESTWRLSAQQIADQLGVEALSGRFLKALKDMRTAADSAASPPSWDEAHAALAQAQQSRQTNPPPRVSRKRDWVPHDVKQASNALSLTPSAPSRKRKQRVDDSSPGVEAAKRRSGVLPQSRASAPPLSCSRVHSTNNSSPRSPSTLTPSSVESHRAFSAPPFEPESPEIGRRASHTSNLADGAWTDDDDDNDFYMGGEDTTADLRRDSALVLDGNGGPSFVGSIEDYPVANGLNENTDRDTEHEHFALDAGTAGHSLELWRDDLIEPDAPDIPSPHEEVQPQTPTTILSRATTEIMIPDSINLPLNDQLLTPSPEDPVALLGKDGTNEVNASLTDETAVKPPVTEQRSSFLFTRNRQKAKAAPRETDKDGLKSQDNEGQDGSLRHRLVGRGITQQGPALFQPPENEDLVPYQSKVEEQNGSLIQARANQISASGQGNTKQRCDSLTQHSVNQGLASGAGRTEHSTCETQIPAVDKPALEYPSLRLVKDKVLQQLEPGQWLGHETIFGLLSEVLPDNVKLLEVSPAKDGQWKTWAQDRHYKLLAHLDTVLIPLHDPARSHWVLLVFDIPARAATLYDSLSASQSTTPAHYLEFFRAVLPTLHFIDWDAALRVGDTPQQVGTDDCGVFVLVICLYMAAKIQIPEQIAPQLWRLLLRLLVEQAQPRHEDLALGFKMCTSFPSMSAAVKAGLERRQHFGKVLERLSEIIQVVDRIQAMHCMQAQDLDRHNDRLKADQSDRQRQLDCLLGIMSASPEQPREHDRAAQAALLKARDAMLLSIGEVDADEQAAILRVQRIITKKGATLSLCRIATDLQKITSEAHSGIETEVAEVKEMMSRALKPTS